ncbi:MAG: cation:proton antiporter [Casimicrobiaceae bacterium]|nr:cation:proton antiporter [Casimicrobiaceae bacterium]MCX8097438.1 cation:proton antiporter [Casimicrobiaceae bacterium]MDW8312072.1 cation:proton antiporter [Burkholderiales bacterium]
MSSALALIVVVLAASVFTVAACRTLGLPSLLGYLTVGMVLGPHAFKLIPDSEQARNLAEYGVVFLMFSIGLEFSLPQFRAMRHLVLGLGSLQFIALVAAFAVLAYLVMNDAPAAFVLAAALAMSSTAIGAKLLVERNELAQPHARHTLGILLFEDIVVVPLLIVLPVLAGGSVGWLEIGWTLAKTGVLLAILLGYGQPIVRFWLDQVARHKTGELFMLNVLLMTLALAWVCHLAGLPLALGAFVAGMLIAETEYKLQVEDDIRPFRDVLLGIFFISVGMQLDARFVLANLPWVALVVVAALLLKSLITYPLLRRYGLRHTEATLATSLLLPAGEFGFVLITLGLTLGVVAERPAQVVMAAMVLLMLAAPLYAMLAERINRRLSARDFLARSADIFRIAAESISRSDHVIICGYGRSGQYLARLLDAEGVRFVALDHDPERVREAVGTGEVVFGDATRREVLTAAGVTRARALVISFAHPEVAERIVRTARSLKPDLPVVVRTSDEEAIERLLAAGATEVVPDALEGALILASHSLLLIGTPLPRVLKRIRAVREERYGLFRGFYRGASDGNENDEDVLVLHTVVLAPDTKAVGKTWGEVAPLINVNGVEVTLTHVRRAGARLAPEEGLRFEAGDVLILMGTQRALAAAEIELTK